MWITNRYFMTFYQLRSESKAQGSVDGVIKSVINDYGKGEWQWWREDSPAKYTENQIHDEEGADNNHRDEVDPLPRIAHRILNLQFQT